MKVALIKIERNSDCYECGTVSEYAEKYSEFEEISEKEYNELKDIVVNANRERFKKVGDWFSSWIIVTQEKSQDLKEKYKDIVERLKIDAQKEINRKEKLKKDNEKRLKKLEQKKKEKELKKLQELKEKYGNI